MPIRINLLAEAQAAEEQRRRDPVKRATLAAGVLITGVAIWSGWLQYKLIRAKQNFGGLQAKWKLIEKDYQAAVEVKRQSLDAAEKLAALQQMTTNRFLWGNALNALQQSFNGVEHVQVTRLKTEQSYTTPGEDKGKARDPKAPKPGGTIEKVAMTIEAIDNGPQPGSQVTKFKDTLATGPWFQSHLQKTNAVLLNSMSAPQVSPAGRGSFVTFTLNCQFQEKVR